MNLKLVLCTFAVIATLVAEAANTNTTSKVTTNKLSLTATSQVPLAPTNTVEEVATNTAPQLPGATYTNTVEMEFVKVSPFWAGRYEVTQKEFQKVMGFNPSNFNGDKHPVDNVSWNDAMEFCKRLTKQELKEKKLPEGFSYRLPTEDEWEFLMADASLKDAVTGVSGPRSGTAIVGSLATNSIGLYDMRGNVMEFCLGDTSKAYRVLRGASWQDRIEINLRPIFRSYCRPDERKNTFGFRCLLVQKPAE
ncbi:MAG: serine/threonine protein kinase [Pedosphaera sp.]|nr:serine/threonine protein kinase [Pedosphaera sp.]